MNTSIARKSDTDPIPGRLIWRNHAPFNHHSEIPLPGATRLEFPDLVRFKGHWFCAWREGMIHYNHPTGVARIVHSADGEHWEDVTTLAWQSADVREPKFSITAEDRLMINTSIYFTADQPDERGCYHALPPIGTVIDMPLDDAEWHVAQQTVTWLSNDGFDWGSAYACPSGVNSWRWATTWHNGMGYSIGQWGKDTAGTLYRTRDGKTWRTMRTNLFPEGHAGEASLAFTKDNTAICLLRGSSSVVAMMGIGQAPYYQQWQWKHLRVDWHGDGKLQPIEKCFRVGLGGPKLVRLSDGRFLGAGRTLPPLRPAGPWRLDPGSPNASEDGRCVLFFVDPEAAVITRFAELDGTSYPGVVEHDGEIWVTFLGGERDGIHLARLPLT